MDRRFTMLKARMGLFSKMMREQTMDRDHILFPSTLSDLEDDARIPVVLDRNVPHTDNVLPVVPSSSELPTVPFADVAPAIPPSTFSEQRTSQKGSKIGVWMKDYVTAVQSSSTNYKPL
ncbi:hypothetical protein HAX54_031188 [Datura stramonium]|uniref:Uncharacterized protein n=1 Tax=Datura stramonium TaxID=4076 RepID=A0ABS8V8U0_DATST|nr:hypothetical protein [Datura stramonium]